jgi:cytochrome c biogenesis protein CcmG/thiol:disulfide interchange protein DsbE
VALGPGSSPRLYLFFATWDTQVTELGRQLEALAGYARAGGLPPLTAVDEATVEPSQSALPRFLAGLSKPLPYPVAVDTSGRVGDGYGVQDEPWFVLVSPSGQILWYYDVSTSGWLSRAALASKLHAALVKAPPTASAPGTLAGSPAPLAALHRQAGQLLGGSLSSRIAHLRGYPIVVNAWASWCVPCQKEFGLFASASVRFGRRVAFVGADTEDSSGSARSFLATHRVSYPSYETSISGLSSLGSIVGLPTTVFISPSGKVLYVHSGQYVSQGTLDQDIQNFALK